MKKERASLTFKKLWESWLSMIKNESVCDLVKEVWEKKLWD